MSGDRALPSGWRWIRLGALTSEPDAFADGPFGSNLKTEHYTFAGARVIRLQNIGRGVFLDHDKVFVSPDHFANLTRHGVRPGDIVVAALGDGARPAGRACVIPEWFGAGLVKADCFRLRLPHDVIDPYYLTAYLNSPEALARIAAMMRGATRPRVTLGVLRALVIPLPPLTEQRRIAVRLNEATRAVGWALAAAEAQLRATAGLRRAQLRSVFDGPAASSWPMKRLGELLEKPLRTGISRPTRAGSDKYCLTLSAVRNGALDLGCAKPVDITEEEADGNWVVPGAFYVVRGNGNLALVGRGALAPSVVPARVLCPDLLFEVVTNPALIDRAYLRLVWDAPRTRLEIETRARTSAGIFKINQENLAQVAIALPPLDEQGQVARWLSERMAQAERLQLAAQEQFAEVIALPAALLRKAFTGEL